MPSERTPSGASKNLWEEAARLREMRSVMNTVPLTEAMPFIDAVVEEFLTDNDRAEEPSEYHALLWHPDSPLRRSERRLARLRWRLRLRIGIGTDAEPYRWWQHVGWWIFLATEHLPGAALYENLSIEATRELLRRV